MYHTGLYKRSCGYLEDKFSKYLCTCPFFWCWLRASGAGYSSGAGYVLLVLDRCMGFAIGCFTPSIGTVFHRRF